jgi:hypothetical protein
MALVRTRVRPGDVASDPHNALRVAHIFEAALPDRARSLARLAAGLQAETTRAQTRVASRLLRRVYERLGG